MRQRAERAADDDCGRRLPEVQPEEKNGDKADEDGGKLEVGRKPRPEELNRLAVPLLQGDVLDASRLDRGNSLPVVTLPNRYVLLYFLDRLHRRLPQLLTAHGKSTSEV